MKLIFVRHGEPNYAIDSLTEKGFVEADIIASRIAKLEVKEFYCSPLGRARATAKPTLTIMKREAIILDWIKEFHNPIKDPITGENRIPWDLMPSYWTKKEELYDKEAWRNSDIMKTGTIATDYQTVTDSMDQLLRDHGYEREGGIYRVHKANDDTLVFFCHLGVTFVLLSHLLGIAAPVLWQGFFIAPTSVTILQTEERIQGEAYFRCRALGDTSHLYEAGEPISESGFFG